MAPAPEMGQGEGTLSTAAGMVAEARHDLDRLDRELGQHLAEARGVWGGAGSSAFQALGQAWADRQRVIVGALDHFEEALRSIERDNTGTDESQSAAFTRTHQRLG
jgi:uncharacterized protein YukE